MLKVIPPEDSTKLDEQIKALEWQIQHDTNEKDRHIHMEAVYKLLREKSKRRKKHE
ncbi:hypothetical protein ACSVC9_10630 [Clostridium sp. LBM24168]